MKFIDLLRLSFRYFKTQKMRSLLTILGVGVGIGAILFLVAMGYGLQRALIARITTSEALLTLDISTSSGSVLKIDKKAIEEIKQIPMIQETSPIIDFSGRINYSGITADAKIHFVDDKFFRLSGIKIEKGKPIEYVQANEVVISSAVLSLLNIPNNKETLNQKINITAFIRNAENEQVAEAKTLENYTIKGIISDDFVSYVYVSAEHIKSYEINQYSGLKVMVDKTNNIKKIREQIIGKGFQVAALSDIVDQANKVFGIMQIILGIFGIISLVVAAIGMFNTMTIALLERTQEIGIMKAIGASDIDIWGLFLIEAMIIGLLGGLSGIFIGFAGSQAFNFLLSFIAQKLGGEALNLFAYPLWFILTIIIFSIAIGLITGFYPAKRAAKLNPLQALRYK